MREALNVMVVCFFVTLGVGMTALKIYERYHPCEMFCAGKGGVAFACEHPDMIACMCGKP